MLHWMILTGLALTVVHPTDAFASQQGEKRQLLPRDGEAWDFFGGAVGIHRNVVIATSEQDDDNGTGAGAAYLFDTATGELLHKLFPDDPNASEFFGICAAIGPAGAIVGKGGDADSGFTLGSAYLFDVLTGQQIAKLEAIDADDKDWFGSSVGVDASVAVAGAPGDDDKGQGAGAAYLFDAFTGQQTAKLLAADGAPSDSFGFAVDIHDGVVIVGAIGKDDNGPQSGAAYLFDAANGQQLVKLLPSDGETDDHFGGSVAIGDTYAVVGSHYDTVNGVRVGSAYVFGVPSGQQLVKLTASDGALSDYFGISVAIDGDIAVVGAVLDDDHGNSSGSAYVFDVTTGVEQSKLVPSDGDADEWFGHVVAVWQTVALVGAPRDEDNGFCAGAAYLFGTEPEGPIGTSYCGPANLNSTGGSASLLARGSDSVL